MHMCISVSIRLWITISIYTYVYAYTHIYTRINKQKVTDEIVYFAGSVGLVLEPNSRRQKHYLGPPAKQGQMKELVSVAMHPSGAICAMGERYVN